MISTLVVFAALIVVFLFLIPGMRPADRRFTSGRRPIRTLNDLSRAGSAEDAADWVAPLIGLMALASLSALDGVVSASSGAALGVFCGLLTISPALNTFRDWVLGGIGIVAAFTGVAQLLDDTGSEGVFTYRVIALTVTLVAFAVGLLVSLLKFSLSAQVGLQAFVVVELVTFLTAPLGVDLVGGSRWIALAVSLVFGLLVGVSPVAVLSLLGLGLAVVTVWATTQTPGGLAVAGRDDAVVIIIGGLVSYSVSRMVVGMISSRG